MHTDTEPELEARARELADLIRASSRTVVLTGAGISTESGIPDFRSPGTGLWTNVDPMEILSVTAMHRDPKRFWGFKLGMWRAFRAVEPNAAHRALFEMERLGCVRCLITQNIDSLHTRAGSTNVVEVHGHMRTGRCERCGRQVPFEAMAEQVEGGTCPPRCGCGGALRPDVVLFEDMLPEFERAVAETIQSDLLLVIGSSLEVGPVNSLPAYAKQLAILNVGPTMCDREASWRGFEKAGAFLPRVVEHLRGATH